jgi:hypothetical protein
MGTISCSGGIREYGNIRNFENIEVNTAKVVLKFFGYLWITAFLCAGLLNGSKKIIFLKLSF